MPRPGPDTSLAPALDMMRQGMQQGEVGDFVSFHPGLSLQADPGLKIAGRYTSPSGRLLELDVTTHGKGDWIALHIRVPGDDLSDHAWIGFTCRHAAPREQMIRPCLRSGTGDGFSDCFFAKHLLAMPEPLNHVDTLHIPTRRDIPETAPWRELVLFLPKQDFRWYLHDLRLFLI